RESHLVVAGGRGVDRRPVERPGRPVVAERHHVGTAEAVPVALAGDVDAAAVGRGREPVRIVARAAVIAAGPELRAGGAVVGNGRVVGVVGRRGTRAVAAGGDVHPTTGGREPGRDVPQLRRALVPGEPPLCAGGGVVADSGRGVHLDARRGIVAELAVAGDVDLAPVGRGRDRCRVVDRIEGAVVTGHPQLGTARYVVGHRGVVGVARRALAGASDEHLGSVGRHGQRRGLVLTAGRAVVERGPEVGAGGGAGRTDQEVVYGGRRRARPVADGDDSRAIRCLADGDCRVLSVDR